MTLALFGANHELTALTDSRPILSGRHPLHQYHGALGAHSLLRRGTLSCFDPAFHAGYPKTPVFDGASRPAELMLALAGGAFRPEAYKIGLAGVWVLVPLLFYAAARGAELVRLGAVIAAAIGVLVWWSSPCRDAMEAGDVDMLLAGILTVTQAGLLLAYHRGPGMLNLAGVVIAGFLSWFAHPLLMVVQLPLFLFYYLSVGTHHKLIWHAGLLGGLIGAIAANAFWLVDWLNYWWIREPLRTEGPLLLNHTLRAVIDSPIWGGPADRALAWILLPAAAIGVGLHNQTGQRPAARLFGLGSAGFVFLAVAGIAWSPLGRFACARLIVPALLFAVIPAAHALSQLLLLARRGVGWPGLLLGSAATAAALAFIAPPEWHSFTARWARPEPLQIGLGEDHEAIVAALAKHTTDGARILWEDRRGARVASYWTALLPALTHRSFVGGLDPDAGIEHTATGLCDQTLAGKPVRDWTDAELREYCQRYNIGWVLCWTNVSVQRFAAWADAEAVTTLTDGETGGCLFAIKRPVTFALAGAAHWQHADADQIVLSDVVPANGVVVLSLHYQTGLRATPSRVRVERELDARDAIPFVRLRVADPVARVTITWERR